MNGFLLRNNDGMKPIFHPLHAMHITTIIITIYYICSSLDLETFIDYLLKRLTARPPVSQFDVRFHHAFAYSLFISFFLLFPLLRIMC
jgi:hypothetical protein